MDKPLFFPSPTFGWFFVGLLLVFLAVAAWIDLRTTRIPKFITLPLTPIGILMNIARGACLGSDGHETWVLRSGSVWLGGLDGFLFALAGLAAAFAIMMLIFALNACAGGDVKLFAGIGAWIGAYSTVFLLLVTVVVLLGWTIGNVLLVGRPSAKEMKKARATARDNKAKVVLPRGRVTFSAAALISTALVMGWMHRYDLQLDQRPPRPAKETAHATASRIENGSQAATSDRRV